MLKCSLSHTIINISYIFSGDEDDDVEVKQTQVSQYESMQISAILQKNPVDADIDSSTNQESGQLSLVLPFNFLLHRIVIQKAVNLQTNYFLVQCIKLN